jgi:VWFA-related protein
MRSRFVAAGCVGLVAIAAVALSALAFPLSQVKRGQRVFIVVARDSRLLTMCPGARPVGRRGQSVDQGRDGIGVPTPGNMLHLISPYDSEFGYVSKAASSARREGTREGGVLDATELDRDGIALDLAIRSEVEKSFRKLKAYPVVNIIEEADYLFLAETFYISAAPGTSGFAINPMTDGGQNFLDALVAIAVPMESYAEHRADIGALVDAAAWEGSALATQLRGTLHAASVDFLVRQFHGQKKRPVAHPPVCAASDRPLDLQRLQPAASPLPRANVAEAPGADARRTGGAPGRVVFTTEVTYVTVPVTVTGADGRVVSGLRAADFRLYEDEVEQRVDRLLDVGQPFDIALLVDTSRRMAIKLEQTQMSLLTFIGDLRPDDRLLLVSFDDRVLVHAELTSDRSVLRRGVFQMGYGVTTRLYDVIELVRRERLTAFSPRKAMVVVTDGLDTASRLTNAGQVLAAATEADVPIYVVQKENQIEPFPGTVNGEKHQPAPSLAAGTTFLQQLADSTGGRLFHAATVDGIDDAFAQIATELGHQYSLGYYPSNRAPDGRYRRIRVEVDRPDTQVRGRSGYRAPREPAR